MTASPALGRGAPVGQRPARPIPLSTGTRAVVISPHPDDGVLGSAGLIQRIVARGGRVEVVEMTSGEAFPKGVAAVRPTGQLTPDGYRWYGALREHEALQAMRALGVPPSRVRLLGFPDEGLCELAGDLTSNGVFLSPYTQRDGPPVPERMRAGVKYRGADARSELADLLVAFRPTLIVLPDGNDEHPDHCATHMLAHEAAVLAVGRGLRLPVFLHYLIHYRDWPMDPTRVPPGTDGITLQLTRAERAGKARAIGAYRSQVSVMARFMHAFDRPGERFVVGDPLPSPACWCRDENIASKPAPRR